MATCDHSSTTFATKSKHYKIKLKITDNKYDKWPQAGKKP